MAKFLKIEPVVVGDNVLSIKYKEVEEEEDFLNMCYRELDCRCIDIIKPEEMPENLCMIVDDEFLLDGKYPNIVATQIYGQLICGSVLIGKDEETEDGIKTVGMSEPEILAFALTYCV